MLYMIYQQKSDIVSANIGYIGNMSNIDINIIGYITNQVSDTIFVMRICIGWYLKLWYCILYMLCDILYNTCHNYWMLYITYCILYMVYDVLQYSIRSEDEGGTLDFCCWSSCGWTISYWQRSWILILVKLGFVWCWLNMNYTSHSKQPKLL